jgi:thioredoxin-like negative regulator of GroEL
MRALIFAMLVTLSTASAAAPQESSAYDDAFEKARQLLQQGDYFNALKGFQKANQLAGGKSAESFLGIAQATQGMKVYKNALDACQSAIELAAGKPRVLTRAHKVKGEVLEATGDLPGAEAAFRAAIASDPNSNIFDLHYKLGLVLLQQRRDEEGVAELRKEIELFPHGTTAEAARAIVANPRRAREKYAPDFSLALSDGTRLSLETLRGKVVLLDFWATWCAPCVTALPSVRKVLKDHAGDPFVLVSVSSDRDGREWRAFTNKNQMTWPQFWDEDHRVQASFAVGAIPTYVLIDGEGIERLRVTGSGFHESRALRAEIDKQIKLLAPARP